MNNGKVLEELQKIIDQSGGDSMPQKNVNQLLLASLVSLMQAVSEIDKKIDAICKVSEELADFRKEVGRDYIKREDARQYHEADVARLQSEVAAIKGNLAYRLGEYVAGKPKAALALFVALILTVLAILGYADGQTLRLALAHVLGVPVEFLATPGP